MARNVNVIPDFKGKDKERYERLINAREMALGRMKYHAEDALDRSNAEKRGVTTHMADVCSDNSRHEMELKLMSAEGDVIELVEQAIQRLIDGNYGKCQDCGCDIAEARLEARPYAIYCIKCKSAREERGR